MTKSMIDLKAYLIDDAAKEVLTEVNSNLITVILRCLLAVKSKTGISLSKMMDKNEKARQVVDAKHIAAILIYNETYNTTFSRPQICAVFGLKSPTSLQRAEKKLKHNYMFRKHYQDVKNHYDNTVLFEYDAAIPF